MTSLAYSLDPSSRAAAALRPEHRDPARGELVGEAGDERHLGPDDDEVDALRRGGVGQPGDVVDGDRQQPRVGGDARVAGRAQQLGRGGRALQRAHERVLAPAGADDEDLGAGNAAAQIAAMKSSIGIAGSVS